MPSGSHRLRVATLLAALLGGGSMLAARPAWSADDAARGAERFGQLCASCHGRDGAGFGPVADSLKHAPPDLRRIAERRGGKFPEAEVAACIDGRRGCAPHGIREMPVWGSWGLRALAEDGELTPAMAELLAFLSSIQVKPAAKQAVRLRGLPFVLRTDVRGYYASIDPVKLVERLACAHAEHAERFLARAMRLRRRAAE